MIISWMLSFHHLVTSRWLPTMGEPLSCFCRWRTMGAIESANRPQPSSESTNRSHWLMANNGQTFVLLLSKSMPSSEPINCSHWSMVLCITNYPSHRSMVLLGHHNHNIIWWTNSDEGGFQLPKISETCSLNYWYNHLLYLHYYQ